MQTHDYLKTIHRLSIPLPDSPLGTVNAYAVLAPDGVLLVDGGWNTPEAYDALATGLRDLGAEIADIRRIVITHIHPDHFGLAERMAEKSGATVAMHRLEAMYIGARYEDVRALIAGMEDWLRVNGVPADELPAMTQASLGLLSRVGALRRPETLLEGGERIAWGKSDFEVLWVPGHSAGLICLYEPSAQILISSDHVLRRISPHVGTHVQSSASPLDDYLRSLRAVRDLAVRQVLPGHGDPFTDLAGRVDELIAHHERRNQEILSVLNRAKTAYEVAQGLRWRGASNGWGRLEPFQRRMAVTETAAHLEHLRRRGEIEKGGDEGMVRFAPMPAA